MPVRSIVCLPERQETWRDEAVPGRGWLGKGTPVIVTDGEAQRRAGARTWEMQIQIYKNTKLQKGVGVKGHCLKPGFKADESLTKGCLRLTTYQLSTLT